MPTVGTYGGLKVDTAALPGVRLTAAETPESEGAGVQQARAEKFGALSHVAGQAANITIGRYAEIQQQARDQADQTVALSNDSQFKAAHKKLVLDPVTGALAVHGKDVLGLSEKVNEEFGKVADAIEQTLVGDRQKSTFARMKAERLAAINDEVDRHTFDEMQSYNQHELVSNVAISLDLAGAHALDPRQAGKDIDDAIATLQAGAQAQGWGDKELGQRVIAARSAGLSGIVKGLLAAGKDVEARAYFEEHGDLIVGKAHEDVQASVRSGSAIGEAQRISDAITTKAPDGTLTDWVAEAKAQTEKSDPEVREHLIPQLQRAADIRDGQKRDAHETLVKHVFDLADQGKTVNGDDWKTLTPGERTAWFNYSRQRADGAPVKTDPNVWYQLFTAATSLDPKERATFMTAPLPSYSDRIGFEDMKGLARLQGDLREGKASAVRAATIDGDMFQGVAVESGINVFPAASDAAGRERLSTLRYNVKEQIELEQGRLTGVRQGQDLTLGEKEAAMRRVLDQHVMLNVWGRDPSVPAAAVINAEKASAYVPLKQIPQVTIAEFSNYVRSMSPKTKGNDAEVASTYQDRFERAYAALKLKSGDDVVRQILEGKR